MKTLATLLAENVFIARGVEGSPVVNETFNGTAGALDIVSYQDDPGTYGVQISLNSDFGSYGEASGDTFNSIEGLIGTNANDSLGGSLASNVLRGLGGDDTLFGVAPAGGIIDGGDTLDGGEGTDTASYEYTKGAVIINLATNENGGAALGDVLTNIENVRGSDFEDILSGNDGVNRLEGRGGNDILIGGAGADSLFGYLYNNSGAADEIDTVTYQYSQSAIALDMTYWIDQIGDAAGDTLSSIEIVIGTNFNDTIGGSSVSNTLSGGVGGDHLAGHGGGDELNGGDGFDYAVYSRSDVGAVQVSLVAGAVNTGGDAAGDVLVDIEGLIGSKHNDTFTGNDLANVLDGWLGADTMTGGDGDDIYYVEDAGDIVSETNTDAATGGTDLVRTEISYTLGANVENLTALAGAYRATQLIGNGLNNTIVGNEFNNFVNGSAGADTMYGGAGNDVYVVDQAGDVVVDSSGIDTVYTSVSISSLSYGIEVLRASGAASISLTGNAFANTIFGNAGNNVINGGSGKDALYGGAGRDVFVFNTKPSASNVDKLMDFDYRYDTIKLENAIFTKLKAGGLAASAFWTGTSAHDTSDRIIYNNKTGALYYDADGTGRGAAVQFAALKAGTKLYYTDFVVF